MTIRPGPRSLPGQMTMLVAFALFVAQAINFGLLLQERRSYRVEQTAGPLATRLSDAIERENAGKPLYPDRGRVRRVAQNPIPASLPRKLEVEDSLSQSLHDAGIPFAAIVTGVHPIARDDPRLRVLDARQVDRIVRAGSELEVAVEQPGHGWLVASAAWPKTDPTLYWRLIGQTLILYVFVLLPVIWIGARIARPLRSLAAATADYTPGDGAPPIAETGPSDVRALITAFNALTLRVKAMLDEKDRMLGAIGHDLRTPLAALRVRIESVEDDNDRARMADTVSEMNQTLDDILSLARAGRPSEPPIDVDLAALVDAVVEDFRDLGQNVVFEETDRLPMRMRPSLMRRAVRNLIENAVKYGGGAQVSLARDTRQVCIAIADDGPGIPEGQLREVFEPFTRLETSRNRDTGGIGLGLALARSIVRDAGGDIRLANRAEGGLAATIVLPRAV